MSSNALSRASSTWKTRPEITFTQEVFSTRSSRLSISSSPTGD